MDMFRGRAHVLHNKLRSAENTRIETLENKAPFLSGIKCHEERVVDIAVPEGLNGCNCTDCRKPAGNTDKIFRSCIIHNTVFSLASTK
jgi:hypothetical protein